MNLTPNFDMTPALKTGVHHQTEHGSVTLVVHRIKKPLYIGVCNVSRQRVACFDPMLPPIDGIEPGIVGALPCYALERGMFRGNSL